LRNQVFLGDEEFVLHAQAASEKQHIAEIPRAQRRPPAKALEHYRDMHASQSGAMAAAYASGDYTMKEIAGYFGVHYSTVSRAVRCVEIAANAEDQMRACKT
jgi:putative transposase